MFKTTARNTIFLLLVLCFSLSLASCAGTNGRTDADSPTAAQDINQSNEDLSKGSSDTSDISEVAKNETGTVSAEYNYTSLTETGEIIDLTQVPKNELMGYKGANSKSDELFEGVKEGWPNLTIVFYIRPQYESSEGLSYFGSMAGYFDDSDEWIPHIPQPYDEDTDRYYFIFDSATDTNFFNSLKRHTIALNAAGDIAQVESFTASNNAYWALYVNDELSSIGLKDYVPVSGDSVKLVYTLK